MAKRLSAAIAFLVSLAAAAPLWADPSVIGHAIKATMLDPTTFAPAAFTYDGTMRDWNKSQVFFRNGFVEQNARFTRSGRSGDVAISYGAGRNQILRDSLSVLAVSAVHNFGTQLIQQGLRERFPEHRKLVSLLGWIERSAVASAMSIALAGPHYRQAGENARMAQALGLR